MLIIPGAPGSQHWLQERVYVTGRRLLHDDGGGWIGCQLDESSYRRQLHRRSCRPRIGRWWLRRMGTEYTDPVDVELYMAYFDGPHTTRRRVTEPVASGQRQLAIYVYRKTEPDKPPPTVDCAESSKLTTSSRASNPGRTGRYRSRVRLYCIGHLGYYMPSWRSHDGRSYFGRKRRNAGHQRNEGCLPIVDETFNTIRCQP